MIGYELIVTAKVRRSGRSFENPPNLTYLLDNPVTAKGTVIDDHVWIKQSNFVKPIPIEEGQTITFSCEPYKYYGRLNEVGYGLRNIKILKINDEAVQVYA